MPKPNVRLVFFEASAWSCANGENATCPTRASMPCASGSADSRGRWPHSRTSWRRSRRWLDNILPKHIELEHKVISLNKYAYYKHVGSYNLIKQAGLDMKSELKLKGYETDLPYIEIYGHWTNDETKCETELFMSLK